MAVAAVLAVRVDGVERQEPRVELDPELQIELVTVPQVGAQDAVDRLRAMIARAPGRKLRLVFGPTVPPVAKGLRPMREIRLVEKRSQRVAGTVNVVHAAAVRIAFQRGEYPSPTARALVTDVVPDDPVALRRLKRLPG